MSYSRVGNLLMTQGNLTEALKSYQDSVSIRDRLAKADSNGDRQRDLATSQGRVAVVLSKQGDATGALGQLREGRAIIARLAKQSLRGGKLSKDLAAFDDGIANLEQASVPKAGSVKPSQVGP
jgi:Tetratricopeptide repeat